MPVSRFHTFIHNTRDSLDSFRPSRILMPPAAAMKLEHDRDTVVVTGGASGLGHELVKLLAKKGTKHIFVLDIIEPVPSQRVDNVTYYHCDVGSEESVNKIAARITKEVGHATVLINNAGVTVGKTVGDLTMEEINRTLRVNLVSAFITTKAFLPGMLELQRGYIVTVSSVLGHMSPAKLSVYGASKAGLIAFHESLTYELGSPSQTTRGVKTMLVTPGQMATPLFDGVQTPNEWLAPVLKPADVASKIVTSMEKGSIETISTPLYTQFIPMFRSLPWRPVEVARRFSGMDRGMDTFRGRL